jgi:hypothetical protein
MTRRQERKEEQCPTKNEMKEEKEWETEKKEGTRVHKGRKRWKGVKRRQPETTPDATRPL